VHRHNNESVANNALARFEKYQSINEYFEESKETSRVRNAADNDYNAQVSGNNSIILSGSNWKVVQKDDKYLFISHYEQMALILQTGLITEDIVFYVYGYELIKVDGNDNFWKNNDSREDPYWKLYKHFCEEMLAYRERYKPEFQFPVSKYKF
jgi:hypothetical protein